MQYIKSFLILTIIVLGGFLATVSAQGYGSSEVANQGLEKEVFKKIIRLPYYGVFDHIAYQIDGSKVILSGKVLRAGNKRDAEYAVKRIAGVDQVVNNIEILPLSSFDNSIRYRLLRTYVRRGGNVFRYLQEPNPSVRLIVERGHITLEGYVANRGDYDLMNILANGVTDVFSVKNNLIIEKEQIR